MAERPGRPGVEEILARGAPAIGRQREASCQATQRTIRAMSQEVERCQETLAHHLLDLPLTHVVYFWVILRLKYRPWRVLIPASLLAVLIYRLAAGSIPNPWTVLAGGLVP